MSWRRTRAARRSARRALTTFAIARRPRTSCARSSRRSGWRADVGKPLVIHTRAADDDTIAALLEHAGGVTVLLHCFSMPGRVAECVEQGWWFSFAGNVTYPKSKDLADAATRVPADRLLVETDAPYLTPQVVRKERNQPAFVTHTARFVAECRGVSYDELDALVTTNAATLFGW